MSIKKIKQYNNEYGISNDGKVFTYKQGKDRELSQHYHKGYKRVFLFKGDVRKSYFVHRLVAEAFIKNSKDKPQVNHKDGNKENNNVKNLEWMTREENQKHSREVLGNTNRGKKNNNYGNRISKLYPSPQLRNRLIELGIPHNKHNLAELGEMLPKELFVPQTLGGTRKEYISIFREKEDSWDIAYGTDCDQVDNWQQDETLANAMAKMLIYLKENNLL